jgi:flavin-dependent dehydrogenase
MPGFGKGAGYAYVVPRREFDMLLATVAREAGVRLEEGVRALGCERQGELPEIRAVGSDGRPVRIRARVVLAADGSRGSFSRTVVPAGRLDPFAVAIRAYATGAEGLDHTLTFFLARNLLPGYGWVFPGSRPGGPANVGLGIKVSALRRREENLRALFDWFWSPDSPAWPYLRHAEPVSPPATFPLQLDFPRGWRREATTLFAGDAAHLIDPMSGEGIAYALESGIAAAAAIGRGLESGKLSDLARYEGAVWSGLSLEFLGAYLLRQVLARPWGNGVVVRLLQRDEGLARGGMGVLSNSVPATWLLRPAVWRKVLEPSRLRKIIRADSPAVG